MGVRNEKYSSFDEENTRPPVFKLNLHILHKERSVKSRIWIAFDFI